LHDFYREPVRIKSFHLLKADGKVTTVTPKDDLFSAVIGGYGLFGVILDADIELTDDKKPLSPVAIRARCMRTAGLR
jgi:FAD/FMN-containing dehydrogenase